MMTTIKERENIWVDCEFIEAPGKVQMVSIGAVRQDDRAFYGIVKGDFSEASSWVAQNVLRDDVLRWTPPVELGLDVVFVEGTQDEVRDAFVSWLGDLETVQLCGYYCAYDHVCICWLFGPMIALPKGLPMWMYDLKQYLEEHNVPRDIKPECYKEHNALADAYQEREYAGAARLHVDRERNYNMSKWKAKIESDLAKSLFPDGGVDY